MAYLYQRIMDVPGLTGSGGQRQKQLYERLGAPMGGYRGTYDQNIWLLNQINKGNFGAPRPKPVVASSPKPKPIVAPKPLTPFSKLLPFERVFREQDLNALASSQIDPEINRARDLSRNDQDRGFAQSGAFRTGVAIAEKQRLLDNFERQRKEQSNQFTGNIKNALTDWYNKQSETYYKNPSRFKMPTLPTFDQFANQQSTKLTDLYKTN